MKNKEIEELLNEIKFFDGAYVLEGNNRDLLLSYIEQLENNRDKAIEICEFYNKKYEINPLGNQKVLFVINNVMNVLKGDSDE